jgi:hypothetical protein
MVMAAAGGRMRARAAAYQGRSRWRMPLVGRCRKTRHFVPQITKPLFRNAGYDAI